MAAISNTDFSSAGIFGDFSPGCLMGIQVTFLKISAFYILSRLNINAPRLHGPLSPCTNVSGRLSKPPIKTCYIKSRIKTMCIYLSGPRHYNATHNRKMPVSWHGSKVLNADIIFLSWWMKRSICWIYMHICNICNYTSSAYVPSYMRIVLEALEEIYITLDMKKPSAKPWCNACYYEQYIYIYIYKDYSYHWHLQHGNMNIRDQ